MYEYDYLVVGAGLWGSVFARQMTDAGYRCRVIDQRAHLGGNCYTSQHDGIHVHEYGPHIMHSSSQEFWDYIGQFTDFSNYRYNPKVKYQGKLYQFPINLMTLYQIFGVTRPEEAKKKLEEVRVPCGTPANLEEYILSIVGEEIYETFIKGYTTKQWQMPPASLPSSIIKRIPIRLNFNDSYFHDTDRQAMPAYGYTHIFKKLLDGIEVTLNCDFFDHKAELEAKAERIVYTGPLDRFFGYTHGELDYRTQRFEHRLLEQEDYQGTAVINYTDLSVAHTRTIEHKHFLGTRSQHTIITTETPEQWHRDKVPYYPINNAKNKKTYDHYRAMAQKCDRYIFGGRLADYKYYDMDATVLTSLKASRKEILKDVTSKTDC